MVTDGQLIHRQYLQSPIWKEKRAQALAYYGTLCGRCGGYGTDVHHKTYERVGGNELMEDLEVLCRSCHEAHHRAERCARAKGAKQKHRGIHFQAVYGCLTGKQKQAICDRFLITSGDLYVRLRDSGAHQEMRAALEMLGMDYAYGFCSAKKQPSNKPTSGLSAESCRVKFGQIGRGCKNRKHIFSKRRKARMELFHTERMKEFDKLKVAMGVSPLMLPLETPSLGGLGT